MTTTHGPHRSFGETHRGSYLFVHIVVSLGLWWLILLVLRALLV